MISPSLSSELLSSSSSSDPDPELRSTDAMELARSLPLPFFAVAPAAPDDGAVTACVGTGGRPSEEAAEEVEVEDDEEDADDDTCASGVGAASGTSAPCSARRTISATSASSAAFASAEDGSSGAAAGVGMAAWAHAITRQRSCAYAVYFVRLFAS